MKKTANFEIVNFEVDKRFLEIYDETFCKLGFRMRSEAIRAAMREQVQRAREARP